ncbi:MAG: hypothetical protein JHC81_06235 [Brevundimonas sp.]|jgi:starvation-inducible outer membrane lipoprotein|uniref:hypothetical protein n=1 Tax=Brevundimonas sp. TaxID=1871086 RepID=UPI001A346CE5|nr:hypothetical protein [Brevundimonas sp.]MBJ7447116.1 hypothetical protein [Brevundimonas sp.]
MTRILILTMALGLTACTIPTYEPDPVSATQWERRQEAIERQQAEKARLCQITKDDDPRKEELCRGVRRDR